MESGFRRYWGLPTCMLLDARWYGFLCPHFSYCRGGRRGPRLARAAADLVLSGPVSDAAAWEDKERSRGDGHPRSPSPATATFCFSPHPISERGGTDFYFTLTPTRSSSSSPLLLRGGPVQPSRVGAGYGWAIECSAGRCGRAGTRSQAKDGYCQSFSCVPVRLGGGRPGYCFKLDFFNYW